MGVVGLLGLLIGSFAILSASASYKSSPPEYLAADEAAPALVLEVERLNEETAQLKGKLEDVGVSVRAKKAEENATMRWTLEVTTGNVSTALDFNATAWELGGPMDFNVSHAMGGWRWVEVFRRDEPGYTRYSCEEWVFNLKGSTVEWTWRRGKSVNKTELKWNFTVDSQSPHHWTEGWFPWTWLKTDYANWAVLVRCVSRELSACVNLYILARERTLQPATLEMLRNDAEQRGFPKAAGVLVDQTSC